MLKELTEESLKNHCAILGKAGSGKTYAAKGIVESLLDRGERVCIVDPTGVWFGLKSKASGKSGAYPIVGFPDAKVRKATPNLTKLKQDQAISPVLGVSFGGPV